MRLRVRTVSFPPVGRPNRPLKTRSRAPLRSRPPLHHPDPRDMTIPVAQAPVSHEMGHPAGGQAGAQAGATIPAAPARGTCERGRQGFLDCRVVRGRPQARSLRGKTRIRRCFLSSLAALPRRGGSSGCSGGRGAPCPPSRRSSIRRLNAEPDGRGWSCPGIPREDRIGAQTAKQIARDRGRQDHRVRKNICQSEMTARVCRPVVDIGVVKGDEQGLVAGNRAAAGRPPPTCHCGSQRSTSPGVQSLHSMHSVRKAPTLVQRIARYPHGDVADDRGSQAAPNVARQGP